MNQMSSAVSMSIAKKSKKTAVDLFSTVRGRIPVPTELIAVATPIAREFYAEAEKSDFSSESVDSFQLPAMASLGLSWVPHAALAAMGLKVTENCAEGMSAVMTFGIDMHVDEIFGPTLFWVLLNDGLEFRQGKARHLTQEGDWFVFTDNKPHGVNIPKKAPEGAMYVGWSVPLETL